MCGETGMYLFVYIFQASAWMYYGKHDKLCPRRNGNKDFSDDRSVAV
jgi:hypothetical protein